MMKILSYPLSVLHYLFYGSLLLIFHPIQWVCIHFIGRKAHKTVVDFLTLMLTKILLVSGNWVRFSIEDPLPENVPIIFVPNHQSLYDIPPLIWYLRHYSIRFVGKKELGGGIPSITINLRNNGSVLIDRSRPQDAVPQLEAFGKDLAAKKQAGLIFPEGTRSRNGVPRPFKTKGLHTIMEQMPEGYVVPITINNSWKILRYGHFPLGIFNTVSFSVHKAIKIDPNRIEEQIAEVEAIVKAGIKE